MKTVSIILFFLVIPPTYAKDLPLFEWGVAAGRVVVPDYPASDETTIHTIAVPSFIYRGEFLRSDNRGTRARFFKNDLVDFDVSFGASLPANSKNNKTREGMQDLLFMMEIGPRATYTFIKDGKNLLELEVPYRFVFSTNLDKTQERGFRFQPQVDYRRNLTPTVQASISLKLNYGTEKLNDYFYQVDQKDVSPQRARYNAKPGFIGRDISTALIYTSHPLTLIGGLRYSQYHDAANENSPLFRIKENQSIFFALNYFFWQSDTKETF